MISYGTILSACALVSLLLFFFFSSRRRHTRLQGDWSSDVCSSDLVLAPAWTSDWLTSAARAKLEAFGIAPPAQAASSPRHLWRAPLVTCPRCGSRATERVSEFGSTPRKAPYPCSARREPFDYFKCRSEKLKF